MDEIMKS